VKLSCEGALVAIAASVSDFGDHDPIAKQADGRVEAKFFQVTPRGDSKHGDKVALQL
jgi:hypothetical protein